MREFDVEKVLPRKDDTILWRKCKDYKVKFIYDDICDYVYIKDVIADDKNTKLILEYNGLEHGMTPRRIKNCNFSFLLKKRSQDYIYEVGEIVNDHEIISHTKYKTKRAYDMKCLKCGYIRKTVTEDKIKNKAECPVCLNKICIGGINDIATTHPQYVKIFKNKEDASKYVIKSGVKIDGVCLDCGKDIKFKPQDVNTYGYAFCECRKNESYPNKYGHALLMELGVKHDREYSPEWIFPKRYDFYFELGSDKHILEMDGGQHKLKSWDGALEHNIKNDAYKDAEAESHGINMTRIDCEKSTPDFIKQSILNSNLAKIFDLSKVDWEKIKTYCAQSSAKVICDFWNTGEYQTHAQLASFLLCSKGMVDRAIKHGEKYKWIKIK